MTVAPDTPTQAAVVDVGEVIDGSRWSAYQQFVVFVTALTIIVDGADNQLLPNAVPTLMREWNLPRAAFANALAAGPLGMMVGGLLGGMLGDQFGRRTALLGSVLAFGGLTFFLGFADSLLLLTVLRFFAGVGLGGAMPNAAALVSEFVPARRRALAITATIVCIPLGGTLAALVAGRVLPVYGWSTLFMVGGAVPALLALLLWRLVPESPRYLAGRRSRWGELRVLMRRMGYPVADTATFAESGRSDSEPASVGELFTPRFRMDTFGLFGAFFFCLMANYIGFQLIPAVMGAAGFPALVGTNANAAFNFGGVAGALLGGLVIQWLGSRMTMLGMSALAVASALVMAAMPLDPSGSIPLLLGMFAVTGGLLNAVQTTMFALAAHVYPTEIRSTGVGTAMAFGRIGNVLAVYVGNFALDVGGHPGYFASWAVTMALVFGSLSVIRRHIGRPAAAPVTA